MMLSVTLDTRPARPRKCTVSVAQRGDTYHAESERVSQANVCQLYSFSSYPPALTQRHKRTGHRAAWPRSSQFPFTSRVSEESDI